MAELPGFINLEQFHDEETLLLPFPFIDSLFFSTACFVGLSMVLSAVGTREPFEWQTLVCLNTERLVSSYERFNYRLCGGINVAR